MENRRQWRPFCCGTCSGCRSLCWALLSCTSWCRTGINGWAISWPGRWWFRSGRRRRRPIPTRNRRRNNRPTGDNKMLPPHALKLVLVEPEIPQNTGNIARLCAATGAQLHLVRPLGFFLSDKHFKRAGMDYVRNVAMTVHDNLPALFAEMGDEPFFLTSGLEREPPPRPFWSASFSADCWIFFGKESAGLPPALLEAHGEAVIQIPMLRKTRGLNVSTAAGIVLYEALRQLT